MMKKKSMHTVFLTVIIAAVLSFSGHAYALTIIGSDTIAASGSSQYTASGCSSTVTWGVTNPDASINSSGLLTTSGACGNVLVAARCNADGVIATKGARVTDCGGWYRIYQYQNTSYSSYGMACFSHGSTCATKIEDRYYYTNCYLPVCDQGEPFGSRCEIIYEVPHPHTESPEPPSTEECVNNSSFLYGYPLVNAFSVGTACWSDDILEWKSSPSSTCPYNITPSAEICGDLKDNNCDGLVDNGCPEGACDGVDNNGDAIKDENCKFSCELSHTASSSVNMASSNLEHSQTLFSIKSGILPIDFELTYNSLDNDGVLGKGWNHPYNISLKQNTSSSFTLIQSYGQHTTLIQNGSQYNPPSQAYPILTTNPYKLTHKDGTVYNFDSSGKLTSIQDRNSNSITFTYTDNNLTTITDAAGRVTTLSYNASNKITTITDPKGNTHTFTYTNNFLIGISTQTTDLITKSWSYTYDTSGFMLTKTDPVGYGSSYSYNSNHKLTSSTDPEGKIRTPAYDPLNSTSTMTERDGGIWTYKYNTTFGSITEKTDPDGNKTTYAYDLNGNNTSITDPKNNITTFTYDTNGNVLTETDPAGKTTTYTYNSLNQILTITDPLNNITTFTYDVKGNRTSMTDPTGALTTYTYDTKGNVTSITNPLNQTTTLAYNTSNNLTSVTDHTGAVTLFTYDISGNVLTKTDPRGNITTYTYDGLNRLVQFRNPQSEITNVAYDLKGNITSITDPLGHTTTYEYNYKGQIKKITDHLGNITQYGYGGTGCSGCSGGGDNLLTITDARGKITTFEYDKRGNRLKQTSPTGKIIALAYDSTNLISSLTDPSNAVTSFAYDNRGLLTTKTDPLLAVTTYTYDNAGRLTSKRDRKLDTINYTYAADGKIVAITYPNASTTSFTYDALDRVTQMVDSTGTTTYVYDDVNRIITLTDPHGLVVVHKYDAIGNLIELTYPGNKKVTYTYDQLNRLKTVTNWLNQTATYNYDNASRLISLTNFNGTITTYGYDNANRLTSLQNKKADASVIATYNYTLNAVGNITQSVQDEPLAPVFTSGTTSYTYNAQKTRLLSAGSDTFTYDNEGQLASGYGSTFTFDYEHRLSTISGAFNAQYFYSGIGNRIKAIRGGVTTKYVYDVNGNVIAEADANNAITKYYVHGLGLMSLITPSDQVYSYHFNNIGSAIAITDSSQNIANKYSYDPFGVILNEQETIAQPFKYVGQYGVMTEADGTIKMGERYYDPKGSIFFSEDPIGFAGGDANLKRYVHNNVVNRIDPSGLDDLSDLEPSGDILTPWHGNWGGPGWTGGQRGTWSEIDRSKIKPPIDKQDECYMKHDMCYGDCRDNKSCKSKDRANCFKDCDRKLSKCLQGLGKDSSNNWKAKAAAKFFNNRKPGANE